MKKLIKSWGFLITRAFVNSSLLHLRQEPVLITHDFIGLADRFLDGCMNYGLEWDDFISWSSEDTDVEALRQRLGDVEGLLFSSRPEDREQYGKFVLEERNRIARFTGGSER